MEVRKTGVYYVYEPGGGALTARTGDIKPGEPARKENQGVSKGFFNSKPEKDKEAERAAREREVKEAERAAREREAAAKEAARKAEVAAARGRRLRRTSR